MKIIKKPTTNFAKGGNKPELVVIHIAAGTLTGTDAWFANPKAMVSSHYGVGEEGEVHQYVSEGDTAWANGRVNNPTSTIVKKKGGNPNSYSISIENEGYDLSKCSKTHLDTLRELIDDICTRNGIPKDREHIIGHYEVYSLKPNCPSGDKSIIDSLINKPMAVTKKLDEAVKELGYDFGENLNDKEMDKLGEKIMDLVKERDDFERLLGEEKVKEPRVIVKEVKVEVPVEVIKEVKVYESEMSAVELFRLAIKKFIE